MSYYQNKKKALEKIDEQMTKLVTKEINEIQINDLVFKLGSMYGFGELIVQKRVNAWREKIPQLEIKNNIITFVDISEA
jgi:hypothetical protein